MRGFEDKAINILFIDKSSNNTNSLFESGLDSANGLNETFLVASDGYPGQYFDVLVPFSNIFDVRLIVIAIVFNLNVLLFEY
jgi:hypothetical protein